VKKLFDKNERYNKESHKIDSEFYRAVKPILERYAKEGYSLRELSYIAQNSVRDAELEFLIGSDLKLEKQLEEERKKEM